MRTAVAIVFGFLFLIFGWTFLYPSVLNVFFSFFLFLMATSGIRVIKQYERGVLLRLGKYVGTINPGLVYIIPAFEKITNVDLRVITSDIPKQEVMTKDNVPVGINAVVFFRVLSPEKAILEIQDYHYAVSQYAQTALRDVIGKVDLDDLLMERDKIANEIKKTVDTEMDMWGIDVTGIKIQDCELPADMKRAMARQAEAEREKRANIITSEGEVKASENFQKAAEMLSRAPGGLQLRTLQTIESVSPDPSNTMLFMLPMEFSAALIEISRYLKSKEEEKGAKKKR